jgi:hypothetical protein
VAVAVSAGQIFQFGNLWQLYRLTSEALERERQLFTQRAGVYGKEGVNAEGLVVERAEHIMEVEAGRWKALLIEGRATSEKDRLPTV